MTKAFNLVRPRRPPTAIETFKNEKSKDKPNLGDAELQAEWIKLPPQEVQERNERAWNATQNCFAALKDFDKQCAEIDNEARTIKGQPLLEPWVTVVKGIDLYWKEVEKDTMTKFPGASPYITNRKRIEAWRSLTEQKRSVYVLMSRAEQEKLIHARKLRNLENRIKAAQDALAVPAAAAKST